MLWLQRQEVNTVFFGLVNTTRALEQNDKKPTHSLRRSLSVVYATYIQVRQFSPGYTEGRKATEFFFLVTTNRALYKQGARRRQTKKLLRRFTAVVVIGTLVHVMISRENKPIPHIIY